MAEPFLGEIKLFAGTFAPRDWAFCEGQIIAIADNEALFSLLGTIYGGDGRSTFGLPDLRGRVPIGAGTGPGLTPRQVGERSGQEQTYLSVENLPAHNHAATVGEINVTLNAVDGDGTANTASGNALANSVFGREAVNTYASTTPSGAMHPASATATSPSVEVGMTGSNHSFNNIQPYNVLHYIICTVGLYPSRN